MRGHHNRVMLAPQRGDLLVRCIDGVHFIVDAVTDTRLDGPYHRYDFAVGIANSMATKTRVNVWRESVDERGVSFGPPQLVTPKGESSAP